MHVLVARKKEKILINTLIVRYLMAMLHSNRQLRRERDVDTESE